MASIRRILIPAGLVAVVAVIAILALETWRSGGRDPDRTASSSSGRQESAPDAGPPELEEFGKARNVGGDAIAAVTPPPGEIIERVAPRPVPAPPEAPEAPAPAGEAEIRLLHRPVAVAAGALKVGPYTIMLEGIEPLAPQTVCEGRAGAAWPCGMRGRTAFRQYLRARAVRCAVPETKEPVELNATCTLAGQDVAAWLVEQGWARAAGPAYAALEEKAQSAGLGIHGDGRR